MSDALCARVHTERHAGEALEQRQQNHQNQRTFIWHLRKQEKLAFTHVYFSQHRETLTACQDAEQK